MVANEQPAATDEGSAVVVRAVSMFQPDESDLSDATDKKYVFAYRIEIENRGTRTVQLLSRHWWITDARQAVREIEGDGVIGQRPFISPGQVFAYSSWCIIPTPSGLMRGSYFMVVSGANGDEPLEVVVPSFSLATPHALN
jgi:ApaG protein